ncbi:NAD(P)(+) transhydrogenase (Re/Si-specific) subunit alpha [Nocardioides sp. C4-1]|uniref:NAD(P)(+) transhydrogenase (Re/Si-specific) subunit alpha n=1 Tax=Nocardioides sp. C4-1 TaxID=3151851 RepID=UPI00326527B8
MRLAAVRETAPGETRVAVVPSVVGRLRACGLDVAVEPGAGLAAGWSDDDYAAAGATVDRDAAASSEVVVSVRPQARSRATTISLTAGTPDIAGLAAYALERVPRTSRAQGMDALTSQSLVAGYRGAIVAAELLRRIVPRHTTAAGTIPRAEVVVLGAGVAGLEAIAILARLGAHVLAYDVRASSPDEVRSVGATWLDLDLPPLDGDAGYARELSADRSATQRERLAPHVAAADVLLTTAAVPGRRAPVLVTRPMVEAMRAGSVVVDLAAESGGNVEGVVAGSTVRIGGARVWGGRDVAAQLPGPASELYAANVAAFVELWHADPDDEIVTAARVTA